MVLGPVSCPVEMHCIATFALRNGTLLKLGGDSPPYPSQVSSMSPLGIQYDWASYFKFWLQIAQTTCLLQTFYGCLQHLKRLVVRSFPIPNLHRLGH